MRWALITSAEYVIPSESKIVAASVIMGQSESDPMMIATSLIDLSTHVVTGMHY